MAALARTRAVPMTFPGHHCPSGPCPSALLGVSRKIVLRSAQDQGLPVRVGGAAPSRGPSEIELLTGRPAAAAGALLRSTGIPVRPAGGRSPFMRRWREGRQLDDLQAKF